MSLQEPVPASDELQIGPALREIAEQLRLRWRDIVKSSWLAAVILFAVAVVLGLVAPLFLASLLTSLVQLALVVLVMVKILRLLLAGEAPRDGYRWGQREWRMLGWLIVAGLCSAVPAMILGGIGSVTGAPAIMFLFAMLGIAVAIWIGVRLMLTTPLVALDEPGNPLARSWQLMKSHTMKALVVAVVVGVLTGILGGVLLAVAGVLPWVLLEAVRSIVTIAQPAIGAVVVAVVFGRVMHRPLPAMPVAGGYGAATVI